MVISLFKTVDYKFFFQLVHFLRFLFDFVATRKDMEVTNFDHLGAHFVDNSSMNFR